MLVYISDPWTWENIRGHLEVLLKQIVGPHPPEFLPTGRELCVCGLSVYTSERPPSSRSFLLFSSQEEPRTIKDSLSYPCDTRSCFGSCSCNLDIVPPLGCVCQHWVFKHKGRNHRESEVTKPFYLFHKWKWFCLTFPGRAMPGPLKSFLKLWPKFPENS